MINILNGLIAILIVCVVLLLLFVVFYYTGKLSGKWGDISSKEDNVSKGCVIWLVIAFILISSYFLGNNFSFV